MRFKIQIQSFSACGADKDLSPERENLYPALSRKEGRAIKSFSCICCFLIAFSSIISRASQVALWLKSLPAKCRRREFDPWTGKIP